MRRAFMWTEAPSDELLMEAAAGTHVDVRLSLDSQASHADPLVILATANMILRLPFTATFSVPRQMACDSLPSPYDGGTLEEAIVRLGEKLDVPVNFSSPPLRGGTSLIIEGPDEIVELVLGASGWIAMLRPSPLVSKVQGNSLSTYAAAAMATAETVRAWARSANIIGAKLAERFALATRPSTRTTINLWSPATSDNGPALAGLELPEIDWVGGGAVTQAALCALVGIPGLQVAGCVFDPKHIDEPDLNRSILSFVDSIDVGKPTAIRRALHEQTELEVVSGPFPPKAGSVAPWVVCGADDVAVRPICQALWPERLFIVATEDQFGQVSTHAAEDDHFCAACFSDGPSSVGPATIVSTSVMSGVVGAATLAKLALGAAAPARTDVLTMRLDSPLALSQVTPSRNPDCRVCGKQRRASRFSL
jgi:hypothetical protein